MKDLLKGLASAAQRGAGEQPPPTGGNLLGDVIKGLTGAPQGSAPAGEGQLLGMLGSVLPGGSQGSLLSLLGGGNASANPMVTAIAQQVSAKLGLDSAIAQSLVLFAVGKLLPIILDRLGAQSAAKTAAAAPVKQAASGFDMNDLLQRVVGGKQLSHSYLTASGLPQEFSEQAGVEVGVAEKGLREVFRSLGEQFAGGEGQAALKSLLGG